MVKNPLANAGGAVQSLVGEDPLEKEIAIFSSIFAWQIPWTEELVNYSPRGHRVRHNLATKHTHRLFERWSQETLVQGLEGEAGMGRQPTENYYINGLRIMNGLLNNESKIKMSSKRRNLQSTGKYTPPQHTHLVWWGFFGRTLNNEASLQRAEFLSCEFLSQLKSVGFSCSGSFMLRF